MGKHIEIPEPQAIPLYEIDSQDGSRMTPDYERSGWDSDDFEDRGNDFQRLAILALDKEGNPEKFEKDEVSTWRLISVTVALCFAMFCVSLVSGRRYPQYHEDPSLQGGLTDDSIRTELSSQLQFPKSPMHLARSTTWAGTVVRTYSPTARCSCCSASCTPTTQSNGCS